VKRPTGDTRDAILAAAATEFAARGFDGASVDAIAARSTFNKAMIYYHFDNKQTLYLEILRNGFRSVGDRTAEIAAGPAGPAEKIGAFIDAFNDLAATRPYMPAMMMREMAEGALRLDADTLRLMKRIFVNLQLILEEGRRQGRFRAADPLLTYFTLITPIIFFRASAPIRRALGREHVLAADEVDPSVFVAHVKATALTVLTSGVEPPAAGRAKRRTRTSRPGVHA
jgi:TetR/AcrR family transcriptional regulator